MHSYLHRQPSNVLHFGGGGGSSGPSATQKQNDQLNQQLLRKQLAQKQEKMEPIAVPKAQKFAPAPTETSQDTDQIARDYRRRASMRDGVQRSRIAGETGGFSNSMEMLKYGLAAGLMSTGQYRGSFNGDPKKLALFTNSQG